MGKKEQREKVIALIKGKRQKNLVYRFDCCNLLHSGIFGVVSCIGLQSMWHLIKSVHLHRETEKTWCLEEERTS